VGSLSFSRPPGPQHRGLEKEEEEEEGPQAFRGVRVSMGLRGPGKASPRRELAGAHEPLLLLARGPSGEGFLPHVPRRFSQPGALRYAGEGDGAWRGSRGSAASSADPFTLTWSASSEPAGSPFPSMGGPEKVPRGPSLGLSGSDDDHGAEMLEDSLAFSDSQLLDD